MKISSDWGAKIVVVTNGKDGTHAYDGDLFYYVKGNVVKKVADTTGVGDCFGSTFVAFLELTNNDIEKSLHIASKNVASVLKTIGAQNGLLKRQGIILEKLHHKGNLIKIIGLMTMILYMLVYWIMLR